MSMQTVHAPLTAEPVGREELERILALQRAAYLAEGVASAAVRRSRIDRLNLAVLEHADELAEALTEDYGQRPLTLTKAFDVLGWVGDAADVYGNLEKWMEPTELDGAFIQQKPLGVVGVIGAWNFPMNLTVEPAMAVLAAGNRVMIKFPDFHVRTGRVFKKAVAEYLAEDEVAVVLGDLDTARAFSDLQLDKIIFTGSPSIGKQVAVAAARNLVPVALELGGKNPVVVARDADLALAAKRIAGSRLMNGGQVCLCPDYVFVPREVADDFVNRVIVEMNTFFPDYVDHPGVVSIVNDRNFDRVVGLIDDAVSKGARKIVAVNDAEAGLLPSRETRRIAPTVLLDVPAEATISSEEVFGPVLSVYLYDDLDEVIRYINTRPSPLAAYYYGEDSDEFRHFLEFTTSGGVCRNDGILHATVVGANFGGVGNSGSGSYHGKPGFDEFTHRRTVATGDPNVGLTDGLVGGVLASPEMIEGMNQGVAGLIAMIRGRLDA